MTAARETSLAALEQDRPHDRESEPRIDGELASRRRIEKIGPLGESSVILLDVGLEGVRGARRVPQRRAGVGAADRERQLVNDRVRHAVPRDDAVERRILVKSPHVGDPFDDFALAPDLERLACADDGQRRQVNVRRIGAIDHDLRLASAAPLIKRREIHEREFDRPLDLVSVGTGEKHDRIRGVDSEDGLAQPMCLGIGEKAEHRLLQFGGIVG